MSDYLSFSTYNTDRTPNKLGQQFLNKEEAANARAAGLYWAEEGQTELDFEFSTPSNPKQAIQLYEHKQMMKKQQKDIPHVPVPNGGYKNPLNYLI